MRILGISGSLRGESHNSRSLRAAARSLPPGVELDVYKDLARIPAFDEDRESDPPGAVLRLREEIAAADALLFSTPEYNASIPGVLKNALDWASRPFPDNALRDRPAAVIGTSTGLFGAVWAQAELRKVLRHAGAHVLDEEVPVPTADLAFTPADELDAGAGRASARPARRACQEATAPLEAAGSHPAPRQPGAVPVGPELEQVVARQGEHRAVVPDAVAIVALGEDRGEAEPELGRLGLEPGQRPLDVGGDPAHECSTPASRSASSGSSPSSLARPTA